MNSKIGFTCSTFDLLHAGHMAMLEEAKSVCDYLIVGLQVNPAVDRDHKQAPIQSVSERFIQLSGCKYVDEIIPYETEKDLELLLNMLPINIRILGKEYQDKYFTGYDICEARGIELYYNSRAHNLSTASLRKRVFNAERKKFLLPIGPSAWDSGGTTGGIAEVSTSTNSQVGYRSKPTNDSLTFVSWWYRSPGDIDEGLHQAKDSLEYHEPTSESLLYSRPIPLEKSPASHCHWHSFEMGKINPEEC